MGYLGGMSFAPDMEAGFFDGTQTPDGGQRQRSDSFMEFVGAGADLALLPSILVDLRLLLCKLLASGEPFIERRKRHCMFVQFFG